MKHISTVPICSKPLFIYKLDIKEDLTLKFNEEKFRPMEQEGTTALLGENLNILKKYKGLKKEINKAVDATLKEILMLKNINYKIFSSWLTKTRPGDCWNSHTHDNSWLTGVDYPKVILLLVLNFMMIILLYLVLHQQNITCIIRPNGRLFLKTIT